MKRSFVLVLVCGCGPTVAVDDDDGATSEGSTSGATTGAGTLTGATTVSTTVTTASTTVTTASATVTTASDETTSSDPDSDGENDVDEGESFIQIPDGSGCFTVCIECDLWAQDCMEGEKCMPWSNNDLDLWNANRCTPLDPAPAAIGEPCVVEGSGVSGIDDCGLAAMCWGVDPVTLEGVCVAFCGGSEANPICDDGLTCFMGFDDRIDLCLPPCDPLAPACAPDEACGQYFFFGPFEPTDPFVCLPIPPFAAQPYGAPCGELQVCEPGHVCVDAANVPDCTDLSCCTLAGELATPPECPEPTQSCIPFDDEAMEGPCYCGVP